MDQVDIAQRAYAAARAGEDGPRQSTPDRAEPRRIIRQPEVMALTGIANRTQLWELERQGNFPKRFALNPAASWRFGQKGWYFDEVMLWIEARGASRDSA